MGEYIQPNRVCKRFEVKEGRPDRQGLWNAAGVGDVILYAFIEKAARLAVCAYADNLIIVHGWFVIFLSDCEGGSGNIRA